MNNQFLVVLTCLFVGLSVNAKSDLTTKPSSNPNPYYTPGADVIREDFIDHFKKEAPSEFCRRESYFAKCFDRAEHDCKIEIKNQIENCAATLKMPIAFDVLEIEPMSAKIGDCIGNNLDVKWSSFKRKARACQQRF